MLPVDGTAVVSDTVRFQIVIANAGGADISLLPLTDVYDSNCFTYITANPLPDNVMAEQHTLLWYDLGRLDVGATRSVTVDFHADAPCEDALNRAGVNGARDE